VPDATGLCWASLDLVSGCGFDGDPEAECSEMVAKLTFGVQTTGVVVAAEVVEAGSGVGQQAPYDDQDGAGHAPIDGGGRAHLADPIMRTTPNNTAPTASTTPAIAIAITIVITLSNLWSELARC
jgi:hypothetical protein